MSLKKMIHKAQQEKKKVRAKETAKKIGVGIGVGAALGSILGVLLAPKAGKETRADLARGTQNTVEKIKDGAGEMNDRIRQTVAEGRERIGSLRKDRPGETPDPAEDDTEAENKQL